MSVERERLNHSYKRVLLLETLYEIERPVSVENLYFTLSREGGSTISINTVYRIIKLLVSFDLVVRVEVHGTPKYILNAFDACDISVICRENGTTFALEAPNHWKFQLVQMLKEKGVDTDGAIELHVDCPA